jgi:hypothetical protein
VFVREAGRAVHLVSDAGANGGRFTDARLGDGDGKRLAR